MNEKKIADGFSIMAQLSWLILKKNLNVSNYVFGNAAQQLFN